MRRGTILAASSLALTLLACVTVPFVNAEDVILNWSSPTTNNLYSVFALGSSDVWAVGSGGTTIHWNGVEWSNIPSPTTGTLKSVFGLSSNDVWAVGTSKSSPPILMYTTVVIHWDGSSWSASTNPNMLGGLESVCMTASNDGWAVGYSWNPPALSHGRIIHWDGSTWSDVATGLTLHKLRSVFMEDSPASGYAVGEQGEIVRWFNSQWSIQPSPTKSNLNSVIVEDGYIYSYAVGEGGCIIYNGGTEFRNLTSPTGNSLFSLSGGASAYARATWAVGSNGVIVCLKTYGGPSLVASPTTADLFSVSMASERDGWAVGEGGTIIRRTNAVWVPEFPAATLTPILITLTLVAVVLTKSATKKRRIQP